MGYNNNCFEGPVQNNGGMRINPTFDSGMDPASRVASEIFSHQLFNAQSDTQNIVRGMSAQNAQQFVAEVNNDLRMRNNYPGQEQTGPTNYLDIRPIWSQSGAQMDMISMRSTDNIHSRQIAEVPVYAPFIRVPMQNYQPYQPYQPYQNGDAGQYGQYGRSGQNGDAQDYYQYGQNNNWQQYGRYGRPNQPGAPIGYSGPPPVDYYSQWSQPQPYAQPYLQPFQATYYPSYQAVSYCPPPGYYRYGQNNNNHFNVNAVAGYALGDVLRHIRL